MLAELSTTSALNWGIRNGRHGEIVHADDQSFITKEMTLPGTAGNGVGVDAIGAYDCSGWHWSIGEVEAALTSAGQRRID